MTIQKFTDLEAWKEAHSLTLVIYKDTNTFPGSELYSIISQLRRAAVSIESCIVEGFSRFHYKDRLNFYYDARGSLSEVQTQIIISKDLGYLSEQRFKEIMKQTEKVGLILGGLIRSTYNLSQKKSS